MWYELEFAGVEIAIHAQSDSAVALIEPAIEAMDFSSSKNITASKAREQIVINLSGSNEQWVLSDQSVANNSQTFQQPGDVIYHLTDRIVFHVADKSQGVHCLHAAAVAYNGCAMVIPANSGAGKSTFTTWLVANGFDYLSDELIMVTDSGELTAIARPIQIKSHGLDPVLPLLKHPQSIFKGAYANAIPVAGLGASTVSRPQVLTTFVFPQYTPDDAIENRPLNASNSDSSAFSFSKLSSADAGMRLMANHVNARNLEGHGFRAMMALMRNTASYSLDYGGFDTLPMDFSSQLKALLQS